MKNSKLEEIIPKELLFEVQKYVQGKSVYIPKSKEEHKKWGENTQSKNITSMRNGKIREEFRNGSTIEELCGKYCLSHDSIKKIIYNNTINK